MLNLIANRSCLPAVLAFLFVLAVSVTPASANPTGAPLASFPVEPCRILDTRVSMGAVPSGVGIVVFVRGTNLPPTQGATFLDCGVPPAAEAVLINIVAITPSSAGTLRVNGVGFVHGPKGPYSRINFAAGQTIANEIQVSLCNIALFPAPHQPCIWDNQGHYQDIAIVPDMSPGASVHVVADVVGYLARGF